MTLPDVVPSFFTLCSKLMSSRRCWLAEIEDDEMKRANFNGSLYDDFTAIFHEIQNVMVM